MQAQGGGCPALFLLPFSYPHCPALNLIGGIAHKALSHLWPRKIPGRGVRLSTSQVGVGVRGMGRRQEGRRRVAFSAVSSAWAATKENKTLGEGPLGVQAPSP